MKRVARYVGVLLLSILIATAIIVLIEIAGFSVVARAE
jgi:hypothetical protein